MKNAFLAVAFTATALGCSGGSKPLPDLYPVSGTAKVGGSPTTGGYISFRPVDEANKDFAVSGKIEADGTFTLNTIHALDKSGERKTGAPAGNYTVQLVPVVGDQTTGGGYEPLQAISPVTVSAGKNEIVVEFPKPKK